MALRLACVESRTSPRRARPQSVALPRGRTPAPLRLRILSCRGVICRPYASTPSCSRVASPGSPRLRVSKVARVRAERGPGGAAPRPNARAAPASYTFVLRIRAQAVCVRPSRSLAASPGSPPCVCRKTHETCFSARGAAGGQHQSGLRKRDAEHRARDGRTTTTHKLSGSEKGRAAREGQGTAEGNQKNGAQR